MKNKDVRFLTYAAGGAALLYITLRMGEKYVITLQDKINFKKAMAPVAEAIQKDFGIKPLITITQSALESGWGKSGLTIKANNLFGFTGDSWAKAGKPVIYMDTAEYIGGARVVVKRPFRKYDSWYDSVRDWAVNISSQDRYKQAYAFARTGDINNFGIAVHKGGYATDPKYPQKIAEFAQAVKEIPV